MAHAVQLGHQYKKPTILFLAVMKRDGYFSLVESFEFNRERARRLMEEDKARVEEAMQREITRLAYERLEETSLRPRAST